MNTEATSAPETHLAVCRERRERLLAHAQMLGLQGFIVFGHGSSLGSGSRSHGALRYLTHWDGHDATSLLVCTKTACALLVGSPFLVPLARLRHPDLVVIDASPATWGAHVKHLLGSARSVATVGVDEMPQAAWAGLRATLAPSCETKSLDTWLDGVRSELDPVQQAAHRRAAGICDQLFGALRQELRTGQPAWRIQAEMSHRAHKLGADYCRTWLTVAPMADYPRYWKEECLRVPQANDQVLFGVMLTVDGHWGHGIRMGHIGQPSAAIRSLHETTEAALVAGLKALRCGSPLANVEAAMQSVLPAHGAPESSCFRYGHGLGHSYEEAHATPCFPQWFGAPSSERQPNRTPTRPGMLLELHPNVFLAGTGGAAIGEMVLVHKNHIECLLAFPRSLADWS
ncbi:M24 family metallopeptidase [Hydrogenophaga sp.]|jgi:Xaa-Pro aminopeptidase|uniref:M24 family metallopeptidase n=1 Tax=Hydrogenophaga sp. TaxID=1904254 RepID=UPI0027308319|nr:M24 family metallopeptidase [Hydrogenophaga sp.]MDP1684832.1 M24 family metallopeptidase [Hydrogenophaga sp.]